MLKFLYKNWIIFIISLSFASLNWTGNSPLYSSIPLSAQNLASAGSITMSDNSALLIFSNPVVKKTSHQLVGFNFNSYFSKEYSSSLFIFPQKYYKKWNYNIGLIFISIPNIPNTQNLFENDIPEYDRISYFNHTNIGLLLNISRQINENFDFGINFIPQYSSLLNQKSYGLFYNIGLFYNGIKNLDYGLILNTAPGSFTYWGNNSIEVYPFTLKNCLIYKIGKVNLFSNINYVMKQKDKIDYSIGFDVFVSKNLKIILGHGSNLKYSTGFLFIIQGVEIQYGLGYQKLETFTMFHHGIDLVFNLNMVYKWKNFLKP